MISLLLLLIPFPMQASDLVQMPDGCFDRTQVPCAVSSPSRRILKSGDVSLGVEKGTQILSQAKHAGALIAGEVATLGSEEFTFKHGEVKIAVQGSALIVRSGRVLSIAVLEGFAVIRKPRVAEEKLTAGLVQKVGSLDAMKGEVVTRVAEPYDFVAVTKNWLRLAQADQAMALEKLRLFRDLWKKSVYLAGDAYALEVGRQMASQKTVVDQEELLKAAREARDRKLRELFRRKTLGE